MNDSQPVLNFSSYAELNRLLSPTNLELLETIANQEPDSIRESAELVGRDYKQVNRNLTELENIGVIEFEGSGAGQPNEPLLPFDGLEIDIPFSDTDGSVDKAAP